MIPVFLMIGGALVFIFGAIFLTKALISPFIIRDRSVSGKMVGENEQTRKLRKRDRRDMIRDSLTAIAFGAILFWAGYFMGFADRDNGSKFYKIIYNVRDEAVPCFTPDGKYISEINGKTYSYCVKVSGTEYEFGLEKCADINELREKLSGIRRENTVVLIDDFAVAAEYHAAEELLKELAIRYETEEV